MKAAPVLDHSGERVRAVNIYEDDGEHRLHMDIASPWPKLEDFKPDEWVELAAFMLGAARLRLDERRTS